MTGWPANPKLVRHLKSNLIRTCVHVDEAVMLMVVLVPQYTRTRRRSGGAEVTVWVVRTYIVEVGTELCFETMLEKCTYWIDLIE